MIYNSRLSRSYWVEALIIALAFKWKMSTNNKRQTIWRPTPMINLPEVNEWKCAMVEEIEVLKKNCTYKLILLLASK
jgi:hypothetical protein